MTDNAIIYNIEFSDPVKPGIVIRPGATDESTSLKLSGNGNLRWGEDFNESLLHVLENFAHTVAPANPTEGQLWFNSSNSLLSVYQLGSPNWLPIVSGSNITANFYNKTESDARYVELAGDTMTGNLTMSSAGSPIAVVLGLPDAPSVNSEAASKKYVDDQIAVVTAAVAGSVTPGTITISAIDPTLGTPPSGYVPCDGTSYTTAAQPDLFNQIRYAFGGGGASFNVPDLRGRFPLGHNELAGGVNRVNRAMPANALGYVDGTEYHTLAESEMPSHRHTDTTSNAGSHTHTGSTNTKGNHRHGNVLKIVGDCDSGDGDREPGTGGKTDYAGDHSHSLNINSVGSHNHSVTTNYVGGSAQHENTPPFEVVYFYIKT